MINPWEKYPNIWKTESSWWSYIRGCLRKAWNRHPVKLEFIKNNRVRVINTDTGNEVWGGKCNRCKKEYASKHLQVDHIVPAGSLKANKDIQGFVERLLFVGEDDLQFLCKQCHRIITYSERYDVSLEEAEERIDEIDRRKR